MAVAYTPVPGLLSQQFPPPLLPKPGKDNVRLQKLLKRTAKKKASAQASQSAAPFRSSLSPVNEASPDLEHSDHFTPPRTPDGASSFYNVPQPPRYNIRPLYQHVASPYPQRAAFGRGASFSPQTLPIPPHSGGFPPTQGPMVQPVVPKISLPASPVPDTTVPAAVKKPAFSSFPENHAGLRPTAGVAPSQQKPVSPGPTPYSAGGQAVTRPLTVLTQLVKPRSPRPMFKATEPSRSPKPMFDVPKIRMYTASTSYYETSRTPPVYDTTGLTSIGSTVPQSKVPTETKQGLAPARGTAPMAPSPLLGTDSQRKTPTSEVKRGTTPTTETSTVTTRTPEVRRGTPTSETRVRTPTYEFKSSNIAAGRPKTPANHVIRAATPVFEISRPNPLLFAVSPITVEPERSNTKPESMVNGDILSSKTPVHAGLTKSKSDSDLTRGKVLAGVSQRPITPTSKPATSAVKSYGYERSKTPTFEASRLMSSSPGYKRPKTPTGGSPVAFQRPKMPTQAHMSKSAYRGLTPAEYAAYGGIKTYTPAFGILSSKTPTQEEGQVPHEESPESKTINQELSEIPPPTAEVSKDEQTPTTTSIPIIVVSQASDAPGTEATPETSMASGPVAAKQDEAPKAKPPTAEVKLPEIQKVETPDQDVSPPKVQTPEAKHPLPPGANQDTLKAVRKLFGKDKAEQKAGMETKVDVPEQKVKHVATSETKAEDSAEPAGDQDKRKDTLAEESLPAAEPLLKVLQKPKGLKSKMSGWTRLKKHMVVEQEEPKFPDSQGEDQKEATGQDQSEEIKAVEKVSDVPGAQEDAQTKEKSTKMWDAVLFQMFSTKENIMHQIELNKSEEEKTTETQSDVKDIPSFAYRLPVLLFSPKFDAKKLREAASRPVTKISTVFEMGLIGRKGKEDEPKDFNRTARGFAAS